MSIASQCADCCTCPTAETRIYPKVTVTCASKTASPTLCGYSGYDDGSYNPSDPSAWEGHGRKWKIRTLAGTLFQYVNTYYEGHPDFATCGGDPTCDGGNSAESRSSWTYSGAISRDCTGETSNTGSVETCYWACGDSPESCSSGSTSSVNINLGNHVDSATLTVFTRAGGGCDVAGGYFTSGSATETLSDEDTVEEAIERASWTAGTSCTASTGAMSNTSPESVGAISVGASTKVTLTITVEGEPSTAYSLTIIYENIDTGDPGAPQPDTSDTVEITTDATEVAEVEVDIPQPAENHTRAYARIASDKYRFYFLPPKVGSGECYRVSWIERVIDPEGVGITSAEAIFAGVYRPAVTVAGDGSGALVVPVMAADGSVDSFRVLHPGSGYTTATITVAAAINGGTTATGTAVLSDGQVASVTKTAGGNYLPTGAFSGGGGTSATITFSMDAQGGISVTSTTAGADYTSEPTLTITPKVAGTTAAIVHIHLGTEVNRCAEWDGVVPDGYDAEDEDTWPFLGDPYFELGDPSASVELVNAVCDCSTCPP